MNTKYEFTGETMQLGEHTLRRIRALKDFYAVNAGMVGGWIEKEENLSEEGNCFVFGEAKAYGNSRVEDDAILFEDAEIFGEAHMKQHAIAAGYSKVFGNAYMNDDTCISGYATLSGFASVQDHALIEGRARIEGDVTLVANAQISGNAHIQGRTYIGCISQIGNNADIRSTADCIHISNIGMNGYHITFYKGIGKQIFVCTMLDLIQGDPSGDSIRVWEMPIDEFMSAVKQAYMDNEYKDIYCMAAEMVKLRMGFKPAKIEKLK